MAPPNAPSGNRIPSLSWESVVDDGAEAPSTDGGIDASTDDDARPSEDATSVPPVAPTVEPLTFESSALEPAASEPITFEPMQLSSQLTPTPPTPAPQSAAPPPAIDLSIPPLGSTIPVLGDVDAHGDAATSTAPDPAAPTRRPDPRPSGRTTITPSAGIPAAATSAASAPTSEPSASTAASASTVAAPPAPNPERATVPSTDSAPAQTPSDRAADASTGTEDATVSPAADTPSVTTPPGSVTGPTELATSTPADEAVAEPDALPPIREATPVPASAPAPAVPASLPALPNVPAAAPPRPAAAAPAVAVAAQEPPTAAARRRQRPRRGLTLLLTMVVLSALVAGAVVFGPRYLFPDEWDASAKPYAEAVEEVRGVEFTAPVTVVAEPAGAFETRMATELTGDWTSQQPEWRALGLMSGAVTDASIAELLGGWTSASYSTADGQLYHDDALVGAELDSVLTERMTAAALDQEYGWSPDQSERTLDAAALVEAEVVRQSRAVRAASEFSTPIAESSPAFLLFMPSILGYRSMAPAMYAEFALSAEAGDPLDVVGADGFSSLDLDALELAPAPTMIEGDTVLTSPRAESRSYWFLVLASYLESRVAYDTSEALVESALTIAQRTDRQCTYATFAGGNVDQTALVRSSLEQWVAAAPAELTASFSVLPDGTLQLTSCDPGAGFENPIRGGVVRELIGWRVAELTTIEAVRAAGGGADDLARSWEAVEASAVGVDLGALPGETPPSVIAEESRAAVTAVFFPEGG